MLKEINLKHFRAFEELHLDFAEGYNEICKPNGAGKTTIADAIAFVLFGKLNNGSANLASLKPTSDSLKPYGERKETEAELVFLLSSGKTKKIRKVYSENWVRTRGTDNVEMKGHNTSFFIDDMAVKATEFDDAIRLMFGLPKNDYAAILTNPTYFSEVLSWQERREIIGEVIGEVLIDEIIATNPMLEEIRSNIEKADGDVARAINSERVLLNAQKVKETELNAQIKGTATESPTTEEEKFEAAKQIVSNMNAITSLKAKKQGFTNPVLIALESEKKEAEAALIASKQDDFKELAKKNGEVDELISKLREKKADEREAALTLKEKIQGIERTISALETENELDEKSIGRKRAQLAILRHDFEEKNAEKYQPQESFLCPNCGFDINAEANKAAEEQFNAAKTNALKGFNKQGQTFNGEIADLKAEIAKRNETIAAKRAEIKGIEEPDASTEPSIETQISELSASKLLSYKSENTKKLEERIEELKQHILNEQTTALDTADIDEKIRGYEANSTEQQKIIDKYNAEQLDKTRRTGWNKELSAVTKDIAGKENTITLLKNYQKAKLEILKGRLADTFGNIEFQLVEENIKADSWNEVCYVLDRNKAGDLIPYATTNTTAKIKIGVKIIETLRNAFGVYDLPIIIDDCEHITKSNRHFETTAQTICLVAEE